MFFNTKRLSTNGGSHGTQPIRTIDCMLASGIGTGSYARIYKFNKLHPTKPSLSGFYKIILETYIKSYI